MTRLDYIVAQANPVPDPASVDTVTEQGVNLLDLRALLALHDVAKAFLSSKDPAIARLAEEIQ